MSTEPETATLARSTREMHELSVAQNIAEIVEQHLPSIGAGSVALVRVSVGEMANVVPESLAFCFEALIEGTRLGGSHLEIELIPVNCLCRHCRKKFRPNGHAFSCPGCGSGEIEIVSGMELNVVGIEFAGEDGGV